MTPLEHAKLDNMRKLDFYAKSRVLSYVSISSERLKYCRKPLAD